MHAAVTWVQDTICQRRSRLDVASLWSLRGELCDFYTVTFFSLYCINVVICDETPCLFWKESVRTRMNDSNKIAISVHLNSTPRKLKRLFNIKNPGSLHNQDMWHALKQRVSPPSAWSSLDAVHPGSNSPARAPCQYPKRRLPVRYRRVSKPRDLYLELSDRSEIWQALRQQCCRCACLNFKAIRQFKVPISWLRDLTRSYEKTSFRILRRGPNCWRTNRPRHDEFFARRRTSSASTGILALQSPHDKRF